MSKPSVETINKIGKKMALCKEEIDCLKQNIEELDDIISGYQSDMRKAIKQLAIEESKMDEYVKKIGQQFENKSEDER